MRTNKVTFCLGPAGSGKTYLAIAYAAQMLAKGAAKKIILSRPMIQVGDKDELGYLPGEMRQKIDPFMRPLIDSLRDFFSKADIATLEKLERLQIIPVSVMRGLSIRDSILIIDEAQNCDNKQLRAALTRFESTTQVIVCGDQEQSDLSGSKFELISDHLSKIDGITVVRMDDSDNQRDPLVAEINKKFRELGL
jgi:phosphate starvation-inducible PhoH-like protein